MMKDKSFILIFDDLLQELHGAYFFTKLDLHFGNHLIYMKEVDIPQYIVFCTHKGNCDVLVIPFVLCNAPSTFKSRIRKPFQPFFATFCSSSFMIFWLITKLGKHIWHMLILITTCILKVPHDLFGTLEVEYLDQIC